MPATAGCVSESVVSFTYRPLKSSLRLSMGVKPNFKLIENQKLSAGHAKILVGLENASFVANKIIENKFFS